ncbi:MAG: hypothetical protein O2887_01190 [Bacteroidetes bacterium]|nr:hypothetical protein [Bacteroidota bacterium]MDA1119104.1 hypothetical protein [Bacteroidota bacterium]
MTRRRANGQHVSLLLMKATRHVFFLTRGRVADPIGTSVGSFLIAYLGIGRPIFFNKAWYRGSPFKGFQKGPFKSSIPIFCEAITSK